MLYSSFITATFAGLVSARAVQTTGMKPRVSPNSLLKRDHVSDNWCGPVQSGSGFNTVEATWKVPTVYLPSSDSVWNKNAHKLGDYQQTNIAQASIFHEAYQWVGIDGTSGCDVILQGGTGQNVSYHTQTEESPLNRVY